MGTLALLTLKVTWQKVDALRLRRSGFALSGRNVDRPRSIRSIPRSTESNARLSLLSCIQLNGSRASACKTAGLMTASFKADRPRRTIACYLVEKTQASFHCARRCRPLKKGSILQCGFLLYFIGLSSLVGTAPLPMN